MICPALQKARVDSEPLVAEHAQWAIDRINQRARLQGIAESVIIHAV
jgi:hypothetical protein